MCVCVCGCVCVFMCVCVCVCIIYIYTVFSGVDSPTSDAGPGTVRCTPMPPPSFSYGGTGLKDLLLKVAQILVYEALSY